MLLTIIDLILFLLYLVLCFRRGGAALFLFADRAFARRFILTHCLRPLVFWCGGAFDLIHTHQLNYMLLIIINLILCRHTFLFFGGIAGLPFGLVVMTLFGVVAVTTTVLLGFLVLMPFGVLTWFTVINLILCC